jgi:hypothetical protein
LKRRQAEAMLSVVTVEARQRIVKRASVGAEIGNV